MPLETRAFFREMLMQNLPARTVVRSNFAMLNQRLAELYGVEGVSGNGVRKVALSDGAQRGGLLTQAAVLKVTANGTNTSPVIRGAWVLERILGTPPPRPPDNVAALEPDTRGATTIRQQLAKHRQIASCASCHVKIDPPGFALESFDVIGGWRENYRSTGNGEPVFVEGRKMPYLDGKPVDPSDNARSLALLISLGKFQFFDGGDLTWNVEKKLVCPLDLIGSVDVYQVTHHGMDVSNHPTLLATVAPVVAIMNNGPRKGGSPATVKLLRSIPSIQAAYPISAGARGNLPKVVAWRVFGASDVEQ